VSDNVNLKPGWMIWRFDQMATNVNVRIDNPSESGMEHYVGLEHLDSDSLKIRRWGTPDDVEATKLMFKKGDIIFARRRAYQRKLGVAEFDGICSAHAMVLRAKPEVVLPEFLPFFMQSDLFMDRAVEISVGSLSPTINWKTMAMQEFALPPIDEQVRLLPLLEAWREVFDAGTQAIADAHRLRRATFSQFFERGVRNEPTVATAIGELPRSWVVAALGDRYEVQLGKMMSENARSAPGQTPYLRNANVQWNRLDLDDVAEMAFSPKEKERFSLRYGDILACEGRHVGKSAIWRGEIPGACYQKALHRLRRLSNEDDPRYLLHCLQYFSWSGRFVAVTGETTIPHLPAERFRAMLFPFPPIDEQIEIAEEIEKIDSALASLEDRRRLASRALSLAMNTGEGAHDV
jgi:type I restriction enzyme S subunit